LIAQGEAFFAQTPMETPALGHPNSGGKLIFEDNNLSARFIERVVRGAYQQSWVVDLINSTPTPLI
jgi:hypothetical protein